MKTSYWLIFLALSFTGTMLFSCKKKQKTYDFHYDYFPLNQGKYVIYQVQQIDVDDDLLLNDTTDYFVKTLIGDTLTDNQGRVVRRYERYYGNSASGPWSLHDIWTAVIDQGRAELVEENNRTIKLIFAPTITDEWNANAYNTLGDLNCYYTDIHEPFTIGGFDFDSTVTVEQENELNFIQYKRKYEVYAKGVGMIKKVFIDCDTYNYDTENVTKGRKFYMNLVSYGVE